MKKILIFITIILFALLTKFNSYSQSLSPERINKIKACTVKITIEGNSSIGTGFFVNSEGVLLTCWHVIEPALVRDINTHNIISFKKIFAILSNGEKIQIDMPINLITKAYNSAIAYDYCILFPLNKHSSVPFLKIGDFNKISEGQEIYTCGYPLGIEQQFVTKGIISTKYIDTSISITDGITKTITKMPRTQALCDLTLNKGNSGGAVVKIGTNIDDDEVIGIADFIINPVGGNAEALVSILKQSAGGVFISGIDPNALFANIIEVLNNTSIGISGCVSINHAVAGFGLLSR